MKFQEMAADHPTLTMIVLAIAPNFVAGIIALVQVLFGHDLSLLDLYRQIILQFAGVALIVCAASTVLMFTGPIPAHGEQHDSLKKVMSTSTPVAAGSALGFAAEALLSLLISILT